MALIKFRTALTGGSASLDDIDGNDLSDGDAAIVVTATNSYHYTLDASSGASESSPDIIAPDTNPGTKRWILVDPYVPTKFWGYELVATYTPSAATLNETISSVAGDTNDRWRVEFNLSNAATNTLYVRFNGDTTNSYAWGWLRESDDVVSSAHDETLRSNIPIYGSTGADYVSGNIDFYLKSGKYREVLAKTYYATLTDAAYHYWRAFGLWNDTSTEVSSITLYTTGNVTGTIRVYKFKAIGLQ